MCHEIPSKEMRLCNGPWSPHLAGEFHEMVQMEAMFVVNPILNSKN